MTQYVYPYPGAVKLDISAIEARFAGKAELTGWTGCQMAWDESMD